MQCLFIRVSDLSLIEIHFFNIFFSVPSQNKDANHQHASAIAARLLKEMHPNYIHQNDDDFLLGKLWPKSPVQTINDVSQHKDSHLMHWPSVGEETEPELDSLDDIFSILEQQWIEDSAEHTNEGSYSFDPFLSPLHTFFFKILGENNPSVIKHVPLMNDHRMNTEDH